MNRPYLNYDSKCNVVNKYKAKKDKADIPQRESEKYCVCGVMNAYQCRNTECTYHVDFEMEQ